MGVLFTEHSMDVVFAHADRVMVLARGRLLAEGTPQSHSRQRPGAAGVSGQRQHVRSCAHGRERAVTARASVVVPTATPQSALSAPLLQVQGLAAWYGAAQMLFGVSLQVGRGEVVALMGRNGAGKSTTLKAIMGMVEIQQGGQLRFLGRDIARSAPTRWRAWGWAMCPKSGASSPT
jgi:branched-chain amino acid transport system ATP-binding protein